MYYAKYYSKRSRDPFRGRQSRKSSRKPQTTKLATIPRLDYISPGKRTGSKPKSLYKPIGASLYRSNDFAHSKTGERLEAFLRKHPNLSRTSTKLLSKLEVPAAMVARYYLKRVLHLQKIRNTIF